MNFIDIITFAQVAYESFDKAHDINHAIKVMDNAVFIYNQERKNEWNEEDFFQVWFTALFHDARDHKQGDHCMSQEAMKNFFVKHLGEKRAAKSLHICDNISWSKEVKELNVPLAEEDDWMRKIVQDADWIEAVGHTGLERCIDYVKHINGNIPADVCKHIHEKLLKITFSTKTARDLAEHLNQPLVKYLSDNN